VAVLGSGAAGCCLLGEGAGLGPGAWPPPGSLGGGARLGAWDCRIAACRRGNPWVSIPTGPIAIPSPRTSFGGEAARHSFASDCPGPSRPSSAYGKKPGKLTQSFHKNFGTCSYATNTAYGVHLETRELRERAGLPPIPAPQPPLAYSGNSDGDEGDDEEEEILPAHTRLSCFTSSTHRGDHAVISNDDDGGGGGDIPWDDIAREDD
jgi:hypothetical protein